MARHRRQHRRCLPMSGRDTRCVALRSESRQQGATMNVARKVLPSGTGRSTTVAALVPAAGVLLLPAQLGPASSANAAPPPGRTAAGDYVVWAVGDVCDNDDAPLDCADVAALIAADPQRDAVLILGDAQYNAGTLAEYRRW